MDQRDIYQQLEELRAERDVSEGLSDEARDRMLSVIDHVEQQLPAADEHQGSLSEQLESVVTEFEVTHPTLASIINNIMVTLGGMGV